MSFKNRFLMLALAGLIGGPASLGGYALVLRKSSNSLEGKQGSSAQLARYASLNTVPAFDFAGVSEIATPAVVHIKTTFGSTQRTPSEEPQQINPFDFFNNPDFGTFAYWDNPAPSLE